MSRPNQNFEKNNHKFSESFGKLIKYCKPYLPAIIIAVIFAIGGTIFTILGPDKLKEMTLEIQNGLAGSLNLKLITKIAFTLLSFYLIGVVLSYFQGFIMATVTQRVSNKMRKDHPV